MPLSMSNYDAALKDFYDGALRETLNSEIPAFATLEKSSRAWSGRRVVFPFRTARNSGVGFRAENGTLPVASNQTTSLAVTSATYAYGRIQLSGPTLAAGKNAFVDAMELEMGGLVKDLSNEVGRAT